MLWQKPQQNSDDLRFVPFPASSSRLLRDVEFFLPFSTLFLKLCPFFHSCLLRHVSRSSLRASQRWQ